MRRVLLGLNAACQKDRRLSTKEGLETQPLFTRVPQIRLPPAKVQTDRIVSPLSHALRGASHHCGKRGWADKGLYRVVLAGFRRPLLASL